MSSEEVSPYRRAFRAWVEAYNSWDADRIMACYDESLVHNILPKSLNRPARSKEEYGRYLREEAIPLFKSFKVIVHELFEDGPRISAHASSVAESCTGAPYENEYNLMAHFAPASPDSDILPKIIQVKEFVDSGYALKFFQDEKARMQERERDKRLKEEAEESGKKGGVVDV
ncbi:hypothetical protein CPC08DRAFT_712369 [Agrocybe pediades]|nr:hypothetical protein CPC08DRAFT_712369 [Agrocybe pediades]